MTNRTRKFLLSVFEYCIKAMLLAKNEGHLALENLCFGDTLTKSGDYLFNKKVDIFISRLLRFIVDGWYTTEGNQELLKSMSRKASSKTKTALKISSTCMDCLATGKEMNAIHLYVYAYVGRKNYYEFLDLYEKLKNESERRHQKLVLTAEERKRIEDVNVYFKMKEAECELLLKKKYEEVCDLHARVPELNEYNAFISLCYRFESNYPESFFILKSISSRSSINDQFEDFIEDIPVCNSLFSFWNHRYGCCSDIQKFLYITDDIQNRLEKFLFIENRITLTDMNQI